MGDVVAHANIQKAGEPAHGAHPHWEYSYWPLVIAVGILFALPLAFSFHFVYDMPFAAVLSLGLGIPLCVIGIVGWTREGLSGHGEGLAPPAMGWFILAEALIFVGFLAAYWVMRHFAKSWPPAGTPELPVMIPLVMTVLLVGSSFTIHAADVAYHKGNHGGFIKWLVVTMLMGTGFLCLSAFEWTELIHHGFKINTNSFGTAFFSVTGFHGAHVLVGLSIFLAVLLPALRGKTNAAFVQSASMYWHFVDIVWLFVVSQVYFW